MSDFLEKSLARNSKARGNRRGYSLVECLATLSVLLVLGMSAATLLTSVTQVGLDANHSKMARAMIERLSSTLREDISQAESVKIDQENKQLIIQHSEQTIEFEIHDEPLAIHRKTSPADEQNASVSNEKFDLTQRCAPLFSETEDFVQLRLTADGVPFPWVIEVAKP